MLGCTFEQPCRLGVGGTRHTCTHTPPGVGKKKVHRRRAHVASREGGSLVVRRRSTVGADASRAKHAVGGKGVCARAQRDEGGEDGDMAQGRHGGGGRDGIESLPPLMQQAGEVDQMALWMKAQEEQKGMQLKVLGVPSDGARSRVETQINLCLQLVYDDNTRVTDWDCLTLPPLCAAKRMGKHKIEGSGDPSKTLHLQAIVMCVSDPAKKVTVCERCVLRERKRMQRAKGKRDQPYQTRLSDREDTEHGEKDRVLLFNCRPQMAFSNGDVILPTRITCYCRHHAEPVGFSIFFGLRDQHQKMIACALSPPIMITDDHKSITRRTRALAAAGPSRPNYGEYSLQTPLTTAGLRPTSPSTPSPEYDMSEGLGGYMGYPSSPLGLLQSHPLSLSEPALNLPSFFSGGLNSFSMPRPHDYCLLLNDDPQLSLAPQIEHVLPDSGPISGGATCALIGRNLGHVTSVRFGDTVMDVQATTNSSLWCVVPPCAQPGPVTVTVSGPNGCSQPAAFTYTQTRDDEDNRPLIATPPPSF